MGDVISNKAAVSGPHREAAAAGEEILKAGGNAVDAAVASMIASCVVTPDMVGIAGYGGSMVIYSARHESVFAVDFDSCSPLNFSIEQFPDIAQRANHGYLSVSVPGVVAGLATALERFGALPWSQVAEPAARIADEGFPVTEQLAGSLQEFANGADETSRHALFPDGRVPAAGERLFQRDLARLIRRLGQEGPLSFYTGPIAEAIISQVREHGGILSLEDFSSYEALEVQPLSAPHAGFTVYTPPPPSGGLTALETIMAMEELGVRDMKPWSAQYLHTLSEVLKACWDDRHTLLADPAFEDVPIDRLLSREHAAQIAARAVSSGAIGAIGATAPAGQSSPNHTVHVVAADKDRNLVSLTATQGDRFGSYVAIDGLGLVLGHGMSRFAYDGVGPNVPAPGKRMQHNMSPTIVMRGGRPYCAVGLPGGPKIVSVTAQLLLNLLTFGAGPHDAIAAPRIHTDGFEPILVSQDMPDDLFACLERKGHSLSRAVFMGGPASAVVVNRGGGTLTSASQFGDPCIGTL